MISATTAASSRYSLPSISRSFTPPVNSSQQPPGKRTSSYLSSGFGNLSSASASTGGDANASGKGELLDRNLNKMRGAEVSVGAWAFLFGQVVSYSQDRVDSVSDLEKRLSSLGRDVGLRLLSLHILRTSQASNSRDPKREHRLIPVLQFITTTIYKQFFGKPADGLEKSVEGDDEYMLTLNTPPLTQFISVPKDLSSLSCEAFSAGLIEGVLDGLEVPARVTAHTVPTDQHPRRTVVLIKLDQSVLDREEGLGK